MILEVEKEVFKYGFKYIPQKDNPLSASKKIIIQKFNLRMMMTLTRSLFQFRYRFFFMIWVLYCFNINLIYQSQLIVMLTQPTTEHQITTPDEIISSGIPFGFPKNFEVKWWAKSFR